MFATNSVTLAKTCYMRTQTATMQTCLRAMSTANYATSPTKDFTTPTKTLQFEDRPTRYFSDLKLVQSKFIQTQIKIPKRPSQITTMNKKRSASIDSPASPGVVYR